MSDGDIRLGIQIRTQGPQSEAATMVAYADATEFSDAATALAEARSL